MTAATSTTQYVGVGLPLPTYSAVNNPEYINLEPATFLHYYNDTTTDETIILLATQPDYLGVYHCLTAGVPANDELLLGPFDLSVFGPQVEILYTCKYRAPADLTLAVLAPYNIYEPSCETAQTVTWPSEETASVVIWPIETASIKVWCSL